MILVKLGGSVITNKSKPFSLREKELADLVSQIKRSWGMMAGKLILGHGSGSFAHVPAGKYQTIKGRVNDESVYGATVVEDAAAQLNRIVVSECLKQGVAAVTIRPFDIVTLEDGVVVRVNLDNLMETLRLRMLPVVYGDVVLDKKRGFTIWSTEQVLDFIALEFNKKKVNVEKIIHCGETDGFLVKGKVIKEINGNNLVKMKKCVNKTRGFDVTGGMLHKIEEAYEMAKNGIDSYIVGGNHGGNLYNAIVGDRFIGTKVTK